MIQTAKQLEALIKINGNDWPQDLRDKAERALLTLKTVDQPVYRQSEAFREQSNKDLADFASAYEAWAKR